MNRVVLQAPTGRSVFIEIWDSAKVLATATGFVVRNGNLRALITNRHVVTGLEQATNRVLWGNVPDKLVLHMVGADTRLISAVLPLVDGQFRGLWTEHPVLGVSADLAAMKLPELPTGMLLNEYDLKVPEPAISVGPSDLVSIVGFPFGIRASGLPIWSAGFVASEPDLHYDDRPIFLIDSRTRPGQSGSPVIAHRTGGMVSMADGSSAVFSGAVTRLLGVYSGRVNSESDLGLVWKVSAIRELVAGIL